MARKKRAEDHVNHEAWAIPYADLMTLLLAFFVVMYAVSSVNEGKYRVLAQSMVAAFRGPPRTTQPIQVGEARPSGTTDIGLKSSLPTGMLDPRTVHLPRGRVPEQPPDEPVEDGETTAGGEGGAGEGDGGIGRMAEEVREALADMIRTEEVRVRRNEYWLEVEVQTDVLFPTAVARIADAARPALVRLADILEPFPNPIRVEGHTDNVPISTERFPSNWELSAARAASVVRLFEQQGVEPSRMAALGLGEHAPVADNSTPAGRNRNRRVLVVILASDEAGMNLAASEAEPSAEGDRAPEAPDPPADSPDAPSAGVQRAEVGPAQRDEGDDEP